MDFVVRWLPLLLLPPASPQTGTSVVATAAPDAARASIWP
jgi:hypothetical protein